MIYIFLAEGFEECEALVPLDILRRGGLDVKTVGVGAKTIIGSHSIPVVCDITTQEICENNLEAIILPGGMPGTINLENNQIVQKYIDIAAENSLIIGAICAAPSILGHKGLLNGKKATCFNGFETELKGATVLNSPTVRDGNIITSFGAGAAFDFGFELLTALTGDFEKTEQLKKAMKYKI